MPRIHRIVPLLAILAALLMPSLLLADGFIIIHDHHGPVVPGHFSFAPLEVVYHRVTVEINDQVATTSVDQEFYNPNPQQLEGTYLFPLPAGSHIDKFSMDVNGKMMEAELLSADKARSLYEEIVRKAKDPALLEYIGRDAFKVRIFPIEPNGRKHVKLSYTQLLRSDTGMTEYVYPLNTEKFSARPLKDLAIKIDLKTNDSLKNVYCPSHNAEVRRDGDHHAVIGLEDHNVRPDTDFKLIFTRANKDIGISLLTYKAGDEGYFLLMASPGNEVKAEQAQPKDICFVLDTSGSMAGAKLRQAQKALSFCLANLNEKDRFDIVRFSTEAEPFFNELRAASKDNVQKAQSFVDQLKAIGGTAIDEALHKALSYNRDNSQARPYVIIFLTDGQPTVGETREDQIVQNAAKAASNIRIFSFGIGNDVNTHLLDRIADGTKAFSQYVLPEEDIEVKLSNFYTKIKEPVLSNIDVAFTGADIHVSKLYPNALPDLFKGQQLLVFGRYTGHGAAAVKITGMLNGVKRDYVSDVNFTANDAQQQFIPRLWATRRVGWLLDEIRQHGESAELKDEVVRLAREHGIVTPYTAYLIIEDERRRGVPVAAQNLREFGADRDAVRRAADAYVSAKDEAASESNRSGFQAVANARQFNDLKHGFNEQAAQNAVPEMAKARGSVNGPAPTAPGESFAAGRPRAGDIAGNGGQVTWGDPNLTTPATAEPQGYRFAANYAQQARVVNGRAFYQNGNTWTDSTIQSKPNIKRQQIKFNSDDYFKLLASHPFAAPWLALGNEVDIVLDDTLYEIR